MMGQAEALLERLGGRGRRRAGDPSVLAVTSGRGGAGVSLIAAALALRSAAAGLRTLLVDADPWLEVQRLWLGAWESPPIGLLQEGVDPESLVLQVGHRFELLSFGSGRPSDGGARHLARRVPSIFHRRDIVVIDAGSGLGGLERALDLNAGSLLVVTGADPVGLAATHALLKAAWSASHLPAAVVFNRVSLEQAGVGRTVLAEGARKYLDIQLHVVAPLPPDPGLGRAVGNGALLAESLAASTLMPRIDQVMRDLAPWIRSSHDR